MEEGENKMTKYERLIHKSELCIQAAYRTKGHVSTMWLGKSIELRRKAMALTVEEANAHG